jgi:hypothetical protein
MPVFTSAEHLEPMEFAMAMIENYITQESYNYSY